MLSSSEDLSELEESLIIIEAIREASLSKFLPEDVLPFEKIIQDVFPGITVSKIEHLTLEVMNEYPGNSTRSLGGRICVGLSTVTLSAILYSWGVDHRIYG